MQKELVKSVELVLQKNIFFRDSTVILCVSGGPDSMAMLSTLKTLNNYKIIAVTVDHKIRPESYNEALLVNDFCKKNNIKHYILEWPKNVPIATNQEKARNTRYKLIFDFAKQHNAVYVLTGHHFDDMVENFFIRAGRGSGLLGLSFFDHKTYNFENNITIIRPLINCNKKNILEYCNKNDIPYINDPSNNSEKYLRGKLRKHINPNELPNIHTTLCNLKNSFDNFFVNYTKKIVKVINFRPYNLNYSEFILLNEEEQKFLLSNIVQTIQPSNKPPRLTGINESLKRIYNKKTASIGQVLIQYKKDKLIFSKSKR